MDWRILLVAVFFGFAETAYFGWNMLPGSPEEMICDGITMLLLAMAFMSRPVPNAALTGERKE